MYSRRKSRCIPRRFKPSFSRNNILTILLSRPDHRTYHCPASFPSTDDGSGQRRNDMAKTSKKKATKTAVTRSKKQTAEQKMVLGFKEGSVGARILGVLLDGSDHSFAEILRGAKPKSEKQTRGYTMNWLARHGQKTGLYQLAIEGERPHEKYRLTVPASTKNVA
jgi:hypothetical protein